MASRTHFGARLATIAGLVAAMLVTCEAAAWGATYYSQGSVAPNLTTSWATVRGGGGSAPANFTAGDVFVIQSGHNMGTTATWSVSGTGATIQIESGGVLTANHIVAVPTFQVDNGGTYFHNAVSGSADGAAADIPGNMSRTFGASSTVEILKWANGGSTPTALPDVSATGGWGNLAINVASLAGGWNQAGNLKTVQGDLSIKATGGASRSLRLVADAPVSTACSVGGGLLVQGGIFTVSSGSATVALNIGGDFNQSGGTFQSAGVTTVAFTGGPSNVAFTSNTTGTGLTFFNWQVALGKTVTVNNTSSSVTLGGAGRTILIDGTLRISSTGSPSPVLAGATTVSGTGSITVDNGGALYMAGTLTNNGTMTVNGTLRFNSGGSFAGTAPTYGGSSTLYYARAATVGNEWGVGSSAGFGVPQNVQIKTGAPSSTIALTDNRTVPGTLYFTSVAGTITTGNYTLTVGSMSGAGATNGWVNGKLQLPVSSTGMKVFDIGDAANYTPVAVAFTSVTTPGNLTAGVTATTHPNLASSSIDPAKYVKRYWTFTNGGVTGTYDATFNFIAGDIQGGDYSQFIVGKYGSGWTYPTVGTKTGISTQATGLTSFSDFAIGEQKTATTYYSQGGVDPGVATNWKTIRLGGGSSPANFISGDVFVIQNGHNMGTTAPWTISGANSKLWIENGGTLTANHAVTLATATTFQIDGGGTYVHNNTGEYASTIFQAGTRSFAATSTVILNNSRTTGPSGVAFGNLTVDLTTAPSGAVQCNGGVTTINGNLTIVNTATYEFRLSENTAYTLTVGGDLIIQQGGTLNLTSGTSSGVSYTVNLNGNFNQTGGALVSGNASSPSTVAFTGGSPSVTFAATNLSSANINWQVVSGKTVTVNNTTSSVTVGGTNGAISINGALQIGSTGSPVLAGATTVSSTTGSIIVDNGGALYTTGTLTNNGTMTVNGTLRFNAGGSFVGTPPTYGGSSTLIYARAGTVGSEWGPGSSVGSGVPQNVQIKPGGLSSTVTLTENRTVPGQLSFVSPGGTIATGSNVLTVGSTFGVPTWGWVNGRLQLPVSSTGTKNFEIGDATNYTPVAVAFTSVTTPGNLTVGVIADAHPALASSSSIDPVKYVNRYWTFTSGGLTGAYNATFNFVTNDIQAGDYNNFIVGKYGSDWTYPTVGTRTETSTQVTGLSSFSDFAIGEWGRWIIKASATTGGSISPSGSVPVIPGAGRSFSAAAAGGYHIVDLVVDGVSQGAITSYTFTSMAADHSIQAHFVSDAAPTDLVAWWAMDEGSGAVVGDGSGHGNDGMLPNGASRPAGKTGTALGLNGVSQYASVPPNNTFDVTNAITLAAWIQPAALTAQNVISKAVIGGTDGYELDLSGDGHPFVRFNQLSQTPRLDANASYPADGSTWMHVAATFDGVYMRIFIDGLEDRSSTVSATLAIRPNTLPLAIGAQVDADGVVSRYFRGAIDDARVYRRALGASEIRMLAGLTTYTITASAGTGGSISPGGTVYVVPGASQTFTITADPGYDIADVLVDGSSVGPVTTYTFESATADHTIAASFTLRNSPPAPPVVVAPPNTATGVAVSPSLDVTVVDPDEDHLTVTYYARPAGLMLPAADFSIVVLPDAQYYTASGNGGSPAILNSQTQWIVDSRSARNTAYVAQSGDLSDNGDRYEVEWQAADAAFRLIEDPVTTGLPDGLPYGVAVGNHEQVPNGVTALYNQYFGVARFGGRSYYGGHYGVNNNNHFDLFSASGMDFLAIYLELADSPGAAVLDWAYGLLKAYPSRRGIVVSHHLIDPPLDDPDNPGTWGAQGQAIYNALKGNSNLFLMLCGHATPEARRTDTYNGNSVHTLLANYQDRPNGGNGWLRILEFLPASDEIRVKTYSPWLNEWEIDASSQFTLVYDMPATTHAPFAAIGTVSGVASGGVGSLPWPGRDPLTTYEWYVTVSDGEFTTTGPTWTFTTGGGDPPQAVTNLTAAPMASGSGTDGTIKVQLNWTPPPRPGTAEVYGKAFGDYPRYRSGSGGEPAIPATPEEAIEAGWARTAVAAPEQSDQPTERGYWYYVLFTSGPGGTSGVSNRASALNYLLGDVSDGTTECAGDNVVSTADISLLGAHYGVGSADTDYLPCLDVGPTVGYSLTGRPAPDGVIEFEDLVVFALNFANVSAPQTSIRPVASALTGSDAIALERPEKVALGANVTAKLTLQGSGALRAISTRLAWDAAVVEPVGHAAGEWLTGQGGVAFSAKPGMVDAAVLRAEGLSGEGVLATVTFKVLSAGDPKIRIEGLDGRDAGNQKVAVAQSERAVASVVPTVTQLTFAQPNPFRVEATLAFSLAQGGAVDLAIYSVDGRRVRTLVSEVREPGEYRQTWDGRDDQGQPAGAGVYYARLATGKVRMTRTIVYLR